MTNPRMSLRQLLDKAEAGADPEFLRDGLRLVPPTRGDRADKQAHERVEQSDNHGDR